MSRRLKFPEHLTPVENERIRITNELVRALCMHQIRMGRLIAAENGRAPNADDNYSAVCATHDLRKAISVTYPPAYYDDDDQLCP